MIILSRYKNGNPKKASRFICLSCGRIIMEGLQRPNQREYLHIKDLYCPYEGIKSKTVEVRWCDNIDEIKSKIPKIKENLNI